MLLEVATSSQWTFFTRVPIPLQIGCWIKLYYPKDTKFTFESITAQGIFKPAQGSQLSVENMELNPLDSPSPSIKFRGCNSYNGIGLEPYGRMLVSEFTTPG